MAIADNDRYAIRIFLNAVLPNLKTVAEGLPEFKKLWKGKSALCQISAKSEDGKVGTHFIIDNGNWTVKTGVCETKPDVELEFSSIPHLNAYFQNKTKKLPKISGLTKPGKLLAFMKTLMKMASLLGLTKPPEDEALQALLVKMYFYLLPAGISQLNKTGFKRISDWCAVQPDRAFSFEVTGHPEVATYLRVKAGNSKVGRGEYTRSVPFFTMRFRSFKDALGTLLGIDDMIEAQVTQRLVLDGAPEVGLDVGDFLLTVGAFAKGA
ncbi:MAG: hypothetical protein P4M02_10950 [Clostridia bacterium]|nr:hypothetical protein [Clostridia bacterium]